MRTHRPHCWIAFVVFLETVPETIRIRPMMKIRQSLQEKISLLQEEHHLISTKKFKQSIFNQKQKKNCILLFLFLAACDC